MHHHTLPLLPVESQKLGDIDIARPSKPQDSQPTSRGQTVTFEEELDFPCAMVPCKTYFQDTSTSSQPSTLNESSLLCSTNDSYAPGDPGSATICSTQFTPLSSFDSSNLLHFGPHSPPWGSYEALDVQRRQRSHTRERMSCSPTDVYVSQYHGSQTAHSLDKAGDGWIQVRREIRRIPGAGTKFGSRNGF
ncbi:hypothetical protein BKA66DRAFT_441801 [Pyrenochaeta sp. MPI-SDFR-AT-0127]|nr:hypothetical protein BKA66DRAFT_441801 [Pyrenochaeta sp. MPI-SDFR-AT-0127]